MNISIIVIGLLTIWIIIKELKYERREDKLIDRIMSKNYQEYRYFQDRFQKDIAESDKVRAEMRERREKVMNKEEVAVPHTEKVDLSEFELDWKSEEDLPET